MCQTCQHGSLCAIQLLLQCMHLLSQLFQLLCLLLCLLLCPALLLLLCAELADLHAAVVAQGEQQHAASACPATPDSPAMYRMLESLRRSLRHRPRRLPQCLQSSQGGTRSKRLQTPSLPQCPCSYRAQEPCSRDPAGNSGAYGSGAGCKQGQVKLTAYLARNSWAAVTPVVQCAGSTGLAQAGAAVPAELVQRRVFLEGMPTPSLASLFVRKCATLSPCCTVHALASCPGSRHLVCGTN